jgi:hypothetical protein
VHQGKGLGGGKVDGDLVRVVPEADHDDIGAGDELQEAVHHQHRHGNGEPVFQVGLSVAGGNLCLEPAVQLHVLVKRDAPAGDHRGDGGGHGCCRFAEPDEQEQHRQDRQRAQDIGRQHGEARPVVAAGDAVQHAAEGEHRQSQENHHRRENVVALDMRSEQEDGGNGQRCRHAGKHQGDPAACGQETTQPVEISGFAIFGMKRVVEEEKPAQAMTPNTTIQVQTTE